MLSSCVLCCEDTAGAEFGYEIRFVIIIIIIIIIIVRTKVVVMVMFRVMMIRVAKKNSLFTEIHTG